MNPIKNFKKDFGFEKKHKEYFIILYLRVLILCLLIAIFVYYYANVNICSDWNGTLENTQSIYKLNCVPYVSFQEKPFYNDFYKENLIIFNKT